MIMKYWRRHGRHDLPWRQTPDPYHILVSEVMLQQTQVARVISFYREFLRVFPSFRALAHATPASVLKVWQGLGYNRRALTLLRCAKSVVASYQGVLPQDDETLRSLPGIGPYTAGAVMAFAFDRPVTMIETNIRRVYIHHFFPKRRTVADAQILPIVARHSALVRSPRAWYSALMDYGSWLGSQTENPNVRSKHYTRQSVFEGSQRQLRGAIVRTLVSRRSMVSSAIATATGKPSKEIASLMVQLEREGFITRCSHVGCVHNPHWSLR